MYLLNITRCLSKSKTIRINCFYGAVLKQNRIIVCDNLRKEHGLIQKRSYSLQNNVESIIKTQNGIWKSLSESTPVEYLQKLVLNIHDSTGLPWWITIICTTILLRSCITVPLAIYQNYILAKVENLHLEMADIAQDLKKELAFAVQTYNWDEKTTKYHFNRSMKKQWNILIVRENCHPFKASILLWFQLPLWLCFSVALRNIVYMLPYGDPAAQITFLELSLGGFGWIPNLVIPDNSLILPVASGLINLAIIEALSKVTVPTKYQRWLTNIFRGFSILMIPIAASVPSCLVLYWTTSSAYGLVQNLILISPKVKRLCRIPQTASELEQPYTHILHGVKFKLKKITNK